jgi:uncharacterized protein (DUF2267 family)
MRRSLELGISSTKEGPGAPLASRMVMSRRESVTQRRGSPRHFSHAALRARIIDNGIWPPDAAERALRSTLSVLGQRLTDDEALALAACLPEQLARVVDQSEYSAYDGDFDAVEFYERVRRREKTPAGPSHEHVNVVLQALGATLDEGLRRRLARALPKAIGDQLLPADFGEPPPYVHPARSAPVSTLAGSRPGSRHPIAEAAPNGGHAHSVARNDDPHSETKLSSNEGLTQERLRESLASGRPPGSR